jgi:hypothetical protein
MVVGQQGGVLVNTDKGAVKARLKQYRAAALDDAKVSSKTSSFPVGSGAQPPIVLAQRGSRCSWREQRYQEKRFGELAFGPGAFKRNRRIRFRLKNERGALAPGLPCCTARAPENTLSTNDDNPEEANFPARSLSVDVILTDAIGLGRGD